MFVTPYGILEYVYSIQLSTSRQRSRQFDSIRYEPLSPPPSISLLYTELPSCLLPFISPPLPLLPPPSSSAVMSSHYIIKEPHPAYISSPTSERTLIYTSSERKLEEGSSYPAFGTRVPVTYSDKEERRGRCCCCSTTCMWAVIVLCVVMGISLAVSLAVVLR